MGDAVADAVDRRRLVNGRGGLERQRWRARQGDPRQINDTPARDGARAFRLPWDNPRSAPAVLASLYHDRVPLSSGVTGRRQPSTVGGARCSAGCFLRSQCAFTRSPSKTTARARMQTSENGARTHDENILFSATPSVELVCQGVIRALFCGAL